MKRRLLFTLISILFWQANAFSQNCFKAYLPNSTTEITEICAGVPVQFKDCSCGGNFGGAEYYDLDLSNGLTFGANDLNSPTKTYTFPNAGTFTVTQLYTPKCGGQSQWSNTYVVKASPAPNFTANICGSDSVNVTINENIYDTYELSINGTLVQSGPGNKTYDLPASGTFTIKLTGKHTLAKCENSSTQTLTSGSPATLPTITKLDVLQTASSGQIQLTIGGLQSRYSYSLEQQNGSIFTQKSVLNFKGNSTETITLSGLNTSVENCFRVRVFDNCGKSQGLVSPTICSTVLQASAQNKKNVISWLPYAGNTPNNGSFSYQLSRQEGNNPAQILTLPNPQQTTFEDTTIICGLNYCYEVAVTENGNIFSLSNSACATAISTDIPKAAFLLTSFELDNSLKGTLTLPARTSIKEQQVYKNRNGAGYAPILKSNTSEFLDRDKNLQPAPICYQVTYTDNCGNTSSVSNESCPVILTATNDNETRTVELDWTAYQGFKGTALTYTLELLDRNYLLKTATPVTGIFTQTETDLSNTDQLLRYRIKVTSELNEISYSNIVTVVQEVKIFIPSAFSPNNDGLNDILEVKGRFQNNFSLVILNRWGQVIFESRDQKKGWDGKVNGTEAPLGVYAYRFSAIDERGLKYEKVGTITLLR